jgi:outer membrane protein OmpA-like peptidoglycan-associated protein
MRMRALALLGAALLLAGCASHERIVVLPAADGHIGGVVVHPNKGADVVLDKAYASAVPGDSHVTTATIDDVDKEFHDVLKARPIPPATYQLYFIYGRNDLTPESEAKFPAVFADIAKRTAAEIVITGHTDPVGNDGDNEKLSLDRAEIIKRRFQTLEKAQQPPSDLTILTVARGKRDAQVPAGVNCRDSTEATCEAARNVEITVQ